MGGQARDRIIQPGARLEQLGIGDRGAGYGTYRRSARARHAQAVSAIGIGERCGRGENQIEPRCRRLGKRRAVAGPRSDAGQG
jgi:hypothetical protein